VSAQLDIAMQDLDRKEGRHANHAADLGGETYRGISRRFHPDWPGWAALEAGDQARADELVDEFYLERYWLRVGGPQLRSQQIANELFEQAVHQSPRRAVRRLQRVLNALNAGGERWHDIAVDGKWGNWTANALNDALQQGYEDELWHALNALHLVYLLDRIEDDPSQEAFAVGWFRRASS